VLLKNKFILTGDFILNNETLNMFSLTRAVFNSEGS
jgi:hypothetical protein